MSVSKSVTATLSGALVWEGALECWARVTDVVPGLTGTSFDGARDAMLRIIRDTHRRFSSVRGNVIADVPAGGAFHPPAGRS